MLWESDNDILVGLEVRAAEAFGAMSGMSPWLGATSPLALHASHGQTTHFSPASGSAVFGR